MKNRAMLRNLVKGTLVDVSECERDENGYYVIPEEMVVRILNGAGKDVADCYDEVWIHSIGRRRNDKIVLASRHTDLYQNSDFECLWLR